MDILVNTLGIIAFLLVSTGTVLGLAYASMRIFYDPKDSAYIEEHLVDPETAHLLDLCQEEGDE